MSEIDFGALWVSVHLADRSHRLSVSYQRLKVLSYLEETYLISHGLQLGMLRCMPGVRVGTIRLDGERLKLAGAIDLVLATDLRGGMRLLVGLKNPLALPLPSQSDSRLPTSVTLGVGLPVSQRLGWGIDITKEGGHPTCIATGVEWSVGGGIVLRSGIRTYPQEFCLGVGLGAGLRSGHGAIDVATSVVPDLGATHEAGGTWSWQ
jgi:hypothetical protein